MPSLDIESRVVIRGNDAKLLTSKDYASPRPPAVKQLLL